MMFAYFKKSLKLTKAALLCSPLLLLTACAVFQSSRDPFASGLKYYLPKTLVTIEIVPVGYVATTPIATLTADEKTRAAPENAFINVPVVVAGRHYDVLVDKEGNLVRPLITGLRLKLSSTKQEEIVADPRAGFTLQYQASALSTDKICMGVNGDSLLSFAQASAKDETGNIIVSIAKLAGRLIGPAAFAGGNIPQSEIDSLTLTLRIDPLSSADRRYVQQAIDKRFPQFNGAYKFAAPDAAYYLPRADEAILACPKDAICYRTKAPLRLTLKNHVSGDRSIAYATVVNRAVTHHINIDRAFLVEKITLLGFDKGVLTNVKIRKDSEALAAAKLPLTIYDAVLTSALAAPGRFLGQITPGLKSDDYQKLIKSYKDNVAAVNEIRSDLSDIRNGDLTGVSAPATSGKIAVTCSN